VWFFAFILKVKQFNIIEMQHTPQTEEEIMMGNFAISVPTGLSIRENSEIQRIRKKFMIIASILIVSFYF
jgi:hypothetical protein